MRPAVSAYAATPLCCGARLHSAVNPIACRPSALKAVLQLGSRIDHYTGPSAHALPLLSCDTRLQMSHLYVVCALLKLLHKTPSPPRPAGSAGSGVRRNARATLGQAHGAAHLQPFCVLVVDARCALALTHVKQPQAAAVQALPVGRVLLVKTLWMTAKARSRCPFTTSQRGDSGRMNKAAAVNKANLSTLIQSLSIGHAIQTRCTCS